MLKLTKQIEYALIAVKYMGKKKDSIISAKEISDQYMIPKELLAKTLQKMVKLNYINAIQGPKGGYFLKKKIKTITLTRFIEDLDGPLGLVGCSINDSCHQIDICNIKDPIHELNNRFINFFDKVNLSEIIK
tara:strand:+ start:944 stop:1339 length:396 start_codon:yes stop_codon:yes gene_type:complete